MHNRAVWRQHAVITFQTGTGVAPGAENLRIDVVLTQCEICAPARDGAVHVETAPGELTVRSLPAAGGVIQVTLIVRTQTPGTEVGPAVPL